MTLRDAPPCQQCGACCAAFRVSFYWAEAADLADALVEQISPARACMRGTNQAAPHCNALQGRVGQSASCNVYAQRPSPCREVEPGDDKCVRARARHGLAPLVLRAPPAPPAPVAPLHEASRTLHMDHLALTP